MFSVQLNNIAQTLTPNPSLTPLHLQSNALEFQYQLCQIFLKKTGEQLHHKESYLMLESQDLLQKLANRDGEKGSCSTDSGSEEIISSVQDDSSNGFVPSRRSQSTPAWRKIEGKLSVWLGQVEEKCSALCVGNLKTMMADYRKLLQRWWQVQARQGQLDRKNNHYQRQHQQNLILKQRLDSQIVKIETMQCQIECLKQKNQTILDYANQRLQQMLGNQRVMQINGKVFKDVKNYLEDKERTASTRMARAQKLQQELLLRLTGLMPVSSCDNCCSMLRKLKDSLIRFKRYLQGEGAELEVLYHKYKKTLFSQKLNKTHL